MLKTVKIMIANNQSFIKEIDDLINDCKFKEVWDLIVEQELDCYSIYEISAELELDDLVLMAYGKAFKDQWCMDEVLILATDGTDFWLNHNR